MVITGAAVFTIVQDSDELAVLRTLEVKTAPEIRIVRRRARRACSSERIALGGANAVDRRAGKINGIVSRLQRPDVK